MTPSPGAGAQPPTCLCEYGTFLGKDEVARDPRCPIHGKPAVPAVEGADPLQQEKCPGCGGPAVQFTEQTTGRWGADGPEVAFEDRGLRCARCEETFYAPGDVDRHQRKLLKATVAALSGELARLRQENEDAAANAKLDAIKIELLEIQAASDKNWIAVQKAEVSSLTDAARALLKDLDEVTRNRPPAQFDYSREALRALLPKVPVVESGSPRRGGAPAETPPDMDFISALEGAIDFLDMHVPHGELCCEDCGRIAATRVEAVRRALRLLQAGPSQEEPA